MALCEPSCSEQTESLVVDYKNFEIASEGLHAGVIRRVEFAGVKTLEYNKRNREARLIDIVVGLTDTNSYGDPYEVRVRVTFGTELGSRLRDILERLNIFPTKDGKFDLNRLVGIEVDVFVQHERGNNSKYKFTKVDFDDLNLRGKGRNHQVGIEIPPSDLIVTPKGQFWNGKKWGRA